jgi:hypothetical protein
VYVVRYVVRDSCQPSRAVLQFPAAPGLYLFFPLTPRVECLQRVYLAIPSPHNLPTLPFDELLPVRSRKVEVDKADVLWLPATAW